VQREEGEDSKSCGRSRVSVHAREGETGFNQIQVGGQGGRSEAFSVILRSRSQRPHSRWPN